MVADMKTQTFKAQIKLPNDHIQEVAIQANDWWRALAMLEAQYGKGCVLGRLPDVSQTTPVEVGSRAIRRSSFRDSIALVLGIAAFIVLIRQDVHWHYGLPIAIGVWLLAAINRIAFSLLFVILAGTLLFLYFKTKM